MNLKHIERTQDYSLIQ